MSFLSIFHRRKKTKENKVNIVKFRILLYDLNKDETIHHMIRHYPICGELIITSDLEGYFEKIKTNDFDMVMIFLPRNVKHIDIFKKMIEAPKMKNGKTIVIMFEQHQLAQVALSSGADYFIMTDYNPELDNVWGGSTSKKNWINLTILDAVLNKVSYQKNFNQSETDLIIEKKEFYDSVHDIFDKRASQTADTPNEIKFLNETLKNKKCKKILDAGCGKGRLTEPLANLDFEMYGIDINEGLLKEAQSKKGYSKTYIKPSYSKQSILGTNFHDKEFDAVIMMWHVICDLKDRQDEIFSQLYRILKDKGIIIFDFPDKQNNAKIRKDGYYEDIGAGLLKYRGMVPDIDRIYTLVHSKGFKILEFHREHWGIDKYVVVAIKVPGI